MWYLLCTEIPRFIVEPLSGVGHVGKPLVLSCAVQPDTAGIRWTLNGTTIVPARRPGFEIWRDGSTLRILSFNPASNRGTYQCIATGPAGTVVSAEAKVEAASKSGSLPVISRWLMREREGGRGEGRGAVNKRCRVDLIITKVLCFPILFCITNAMRIECYILGSSSKLHFLPLHSPQKKSKLRWKQLTITRK